MERVVMETVGGEDNQATLALTDPHETVVITSHPDSAAIPVCTIPSSQQDESNNFVQIFHDYDTSDNSVVVVKSAVEADDGGQVSSGGLVGEAENTLCVVCSDRGSGFHYSAYTCEGCKGFFKRTVQKNLTYCCKDSGTCVINKLTRNSCQFCRFHKCLQSGMQREAVREDRSPGGKHRHKRMRVEDGVVGEAGTVVTEADMGAAILPTSLSSAEDSIITQLIESKPDLVPDASGSPPGSQMDINMLMQYGYMELRLIIEWARKIPGFSSLIIEDQMALLKASFMELNVLRLAFRSLPHDGAVKFCEEIVMTESESVDIGWGKDLITCTLEFISHMKEIAIDHTEFCILNAIMLTYPDATGIQDKVAITQLQSRFIDCLWKYSSTQYPSDTLRYGKMLLRLPSLRTVSAKAAERFLSMSLDGSIKMNALVLEMMS